MSARDADRIKCHIFFFQAEDGIRDRNVTGVQTCALPICQRALERQAPRPEDEPVSWRWLIAAIVSLAAGVILVLLAVDVGRWNTAFARDDVRFKFQPTRSDLWKPNELVPFHTAKRLLAVDDDLFYRDTLRHFYLAQPRANKWEHTNIDAIRSEATVALAAYIREGKSQARRSQAANLLGILGLALAATDDPG